MAASDISGSLFVGVASSAPVSNTTSETTLVPTSLVGSVTIPANYFVVGRSVRIMLHGFYKNITNHTARLRAKLTDTTPITVTVADTTARALAIGSGTNRAFSLGVTLTCRAVGVAGTIMGQMVAYFEGNASYVQALNIVPSTIDTTKAQVVGLTFQWGTANSGDSVTITNIDARAVF